MEAYVTQNFDECYERVVNGSSDFFYLLTSTALVAANQRYCGKLTVVGESFFDTSLSFLLPKGSNLTETFSVETLNLQNEGKLQSAFSYATRNKCPDVTDPTVVSILLSAHVEASARSSV